MSKSCFRCYAGSITITWKTNKQKALSITTVLEECTLIHFKFIINKPEMVVAYVK